MKEQAVKPHGRHVNHRSFAALVLLLLTSFLIGNISAQTSTYNEAPQLAQQVAAGELPPVEERLPNNPVVVEPNERIGQYGGTWNTALVGGEDTLWLLRTIGYDNLLRWNVAWSEIIPNVAESYEASDDSREFTFRLREGLRWSDGEPFTADDIMFWYEGVFLDETLNPVQSGLLMGAPLEAVEKVDDYTVVFRFAEPNGLFLQRMAGAGASAFTLHPRHYLEQFHERYNPEGIDALVQEAGVNDWATLFSQRNDLWRNAELPTLLAWRLTNAYGEGTRVVAERNPYYFKVDPEGNQLPYIDQIMYDILDNTEVLLLRALSGEIDMMSRHFNTLANRAVLFDNMERGDYRFFEIIPSTMNTAIVALNLTHKDPVKREIFNNRDFRIGLSYAIDRQAIIDLVFVGQGEPWQSAPRPESPFYDEAMAKQHVEYNVELANEYLDRAFPERDAQGYRLGPDGNRISFAMETIPAIGSWIDVLELVEGYWEAVGIDVQVRSMDRSLFETRKNANEHDAAVWYGFGGLRDVLTDPRWHVPVSPSDSMYGVAWAYWWLDPNHTLAEEPPAVVREQMDLYRQLGATSDDNQQAELMRQILDIAAEEFHVFGISLPAPEYGIVKNNFHNVPDPMLEGGSAYLIPAPTNPSQYFISE